MTALEIHDVSHKYRKALDGVSFQIRPGDFAVLLGLNGAGKTTLFSLVAGLRNRSGTSRVRPRPAAAQSALGWGRVPAARSISI